jgi:hypothetical protein
MTRDEQTIVLYYARPWAAEQFRMICAEAFPDAARTTHIADSLGVGDGRLQERFYAHLAGAPRAAGAAEEKDPVFVDVRRRCRLLRRISLDEAARIVRAMSAAIDEILTEVAPTVVVSSTVDSYVVDLLRVACLRRGLPFIGVAPVFVNGYWRLTSRGEHHTVRVPPAEEVAAVLDTLIDPRYDPIYLVRGAGRLGVAARSAQRALRNFGRFTYFTGKRRLSPDPLRYHDWSSQIVARDVLTWRWARYPGDDAWAVKLAALDGRKSVYLPLQYSPEGTVDYWCRSADVIDYYPVLFEVLEALAKHDVPVLVKEHPGALGVRPPWLYDRITAHANVILVPPDVRSNDVIPVCDAVLVWTGTVGFEAALRGKSVIHLGAPYYVSGDRFWEVDTLGRFGAVATEALEEAARPITRAEQMAMVAHVLSGCLPGNLRQGRGIDFSRPDYRAEVSEIARGVKQIAARRADAVSAFEALGG